MLVLLAAWNILEYAEANDAFRRLRSSRAWLGMAPVVGDVGDDARSSAPVAAFCFMPLRIGCTKMYQDDPPCTYHRQSLLQPLQCQYSVQSTSDSESNVFLGCIRHQGNIRGMDAVDRSVIGKTHCSSQPGDLLATIASGSK